MQLSNRLKTVADIVTKGNRVADVGCDHAYIAIHLAENNIAPKVIAMDVNKGPLSKAQENIALWGLADKIETRLSDGLLKLRPGEADSIVIAGMGGALMVKILKEGEKSLAGVKELILQPQSEIFLLRRYLHGKDYEIETEKMVKEDEKFYVIIKAVKSKNAETYEKEIFYLYGKLLLEGGEPVVKEYLEREKRLKVQVKEVLAESASQGSTRRLEEIREELSAVEEALKYF
ncbi:tRNA (adenine(22)-N(1))-methyltransferase [Anaerocolumna jejuensis]|uniref:tRNA (adenine(22)-N(1))-methyltransferase n=1 Tax=Anaerocolumna jejuensis TaxID=259063 RepID=UPI003F7B9E4B